ncbi:MAG: hypothetical protein ACPGVL_17655 [Pseudoalteromonas spongiae]|jgi:hypothetical protein|nr:hypothetical protein [Pseudoalteromonas sp.]|tara:strand:- start:2186 stop:2662 length:477 start_codon:yes stop_codon:yes gene_type:complete
MKTTTLIASVFLALTFNAAANTAEQEIKTTDFNTFYDTQVANSDCGGYWDERRVRVCDYRTELTDVAYKTCHYKLMYAHSNSTAPAWETKTVLASNSCPASWTIPGPYGHAPGGVYIHQHDTFFTQQESKTVAYNCRWETRSVWVPNGGEFCPIEPNK